MKTVSNELHNNKYARNMMSSSELRRINKPIVEKKRRERINGCLEELKTLLLQSTNTHESSASKLEKADILEMAVRHLRQIQPGTQQQQQQQQSVTEDAMQYKEGYNDCAREVAAYLDHTDSLNDTDKSRVLCQLSARLSNINNNINTQSGIATAVNSPVAIHANNFYLTDSSVHSLQPSFFRQSVSPIYPTTTISEYHAMNVDTHCNYSSGRNSTLHSPSSVASATENISHSRRRFKSTLNDKKVNNIKTHNNVRISSDSRAYSEAAGSPDNYPYTRSDNFRALHDFTSADRHASRENANYRNNARWACDEDFRSSASVGYSQSEDGADRRSNLPIRTHHLTSRRRSIALREISSTVVMATSSADVIPCLNSSDVSWTADSSCTARSGFEPTSSCAADSPSTNTPCVESSYSDRSSMAVSPKCERSGSELQRSNTDINGNDSTSVQSKPCSSTQNDDDDESMWRPW